MEHEKERKLTYLGLETHLRLEPLPSSPLSQLYFVVVVVAVISRNTVKNY
jgi:hypothetical protein